MWDQMQVHHGYCVKWEMEEWMQETHQRGGQDSDHRSITDHVGPHAWQYDDHHQRINEVLQWCRYSLASTLFVNGKDNHLLPCLLTGVILRIKNKPVNINVLWELPGLMQRLVLTMCRGEARAKGAHCPRLYSERTTRCLDNLTGCSYPKTSGCSPDSLFEGK